METDDDIGEDKFQIGDEEPKRKPRVPGPPVVGLPEKPEPKVCKPSRDEEAYQRYKVALPRECCAPMRQQFVESADDPQHNGFWQWEGVIQVGADGEWQCETPFVFCPFCGKRYEFGERNG